MAAQEDLRQGTLVKIEYTMDYGIVSQLVHHRDKWISKPIKDFIELSENIFSSAGINRVT